MTVRVGVVGCGAVACEQHLPSLRRIEGATVVALADPDPAARARAARLAPEAASYAEAGELLARGDVDAVVVAAPPALHADLAAAVAGVGKHLYLEKPLATGEDEALRAMEAVDGSGVIAAMGFNRRRHPACQEARRLVEAGELGAVRFARTAFCEPGELPGWKRSRATGGGVLLDLASHHFDLVRWLLGAELEVAGARTWSGLSEGDEATVELSSETGAAVQSVFSFRAAHADSVELIGERGRVLIDRHGGSLAVHRRRVSGYGIRRVRRLSDVRALATRGDPSYGRALEAFVQHVAGAEAELPSLDDGLRSLQLVLAAERLATPLAGAPRGAR